MALKNFGPISIIRKNLKCVHTTHMPPPSTLSKMAPCLSTGTCWITRLTEADLYNIKGNNTNPKILSLQNHPRSHVSRPHYTDHMTRFSYIPDVLIDINPHTQLQVAPIIRTLKSTYYINLNIAKLA